MSEIQLLERPSWIRVRRLDDAVRAQIRASVGASATVCQSANCPNIGECWARGTATYMIMGHVCTRNCAFCDVDFGRPEPLDPAEPARIAASVDELGLKYVVMTCVDRDDLPDSGAAHWAATIEAIRAVRGELVLNNLRGAGRWPADSVGAKPASPAPVGELLMAPAGGINAAPTVGTRFTASADAINGVPTKKVGEIFGSRYVAGAGIEILTGDFKGDEAAIRQVVAARPDVFAHNVETVPRLQKLARHKANWERSVRVLQIAKEASGGSAVLGSAAVSGRGMHPTPENAGTEARTPLHSTPMFIKTGMMLGLGESDAEVREAMNLLRQAGVELLTLGQYLKPRNIAGKLDMQRWVSPEQFAALAEYGRSIGFTGVAASPLTRSSYLAETLYAQALDAARG